MLYNKRRPAITWPLGKGDDKHGDGWPEVYLIGRMDG